MHDEKVGWASCFVQQSGKKQKRLKFCFTPYWWLLSQIEIVFSTLNILTALLFMSYALLIRMHKRNNLSLIFMFSSRWGVLVVYISCGPHGFREDLKSSSHYKSVGAIFCHGNQSFPFPAAFTLT